MKTNLLIATAFIVLIVSINVSSATITGTPPNSSGITYIMNDTVWDNENINLEGDVYIGNASRSEKVYFNITNSTITTTSNVGKFYVGVEYGYNYKEADLKIFNSTITFNTTNSLFGGITVENTVDANSKLEITNSTIQGISKSNKCGGILLKSGWQNQYHLLILENTTLRYMGSPYAVNTRFWNNDASKAKSGSTIYNVVLDNCGWGIRLGKNGIEADYVTTYQGSVLFFYGSSWNHITMYSGTEGLYDPADGAWIRNSWFDAKSTKFNIMSACNVIFEDNTVVNAAFNMGDGGYHQGNNNTVRNCTLINTGINNMRSYAHIYNNTFDGGFNGGGNIPIRLWGWNFDVYNNNIQDGANGLEVIPHPYNGNAGNHTVRNNIINGALNTGIKIENEYNNTFINNKITNTSVGISSLKSTTQIFRDTYISNSNTYDIRFCGGNANDNVFINTHFDGSKVHFDDDTDIFKNGYYIDMFVKDTAGNPISGASVSITNEVDSVFNANGNVKNTFTTGANGHTPLPTDPVNSAVILDYWQTNTEKTEMTYTITVEKDGYSTTVTGINPNETWYRSDPNTPTYTLAITLPSDVDLIPTASAGPDRTAYADDSLTFDGSGSTDDHGITSYVWDFDASDGLQQDATGEVVTHTYDTAGTYTVTLAVTDTNGNINSDTAVITVNDVSTLSIITGVTATSITNASATVIWNTDKASDSLVKYSTVSGVYTAEVYNAANVASHSINLAGLTPDTTYYYVVNSTNPEGNTNESIEYSFITETSTDDAPVLTQMNISLVSTPIIIDGNLNEWTGIKSVSFKDDSGRGDAENLAIVKAMWDDNYLYFAFDVTDTNLQAVETLRDGAIWRDDSIELFIDMDHNHGTQMQIDDYHFIINLNNAIWDSKGTGSGQNADWDSILNSAVVTDGTIGDDSDSDTGYVIEMGIPWSDLGGTPLSGSKIGLDLCVDDLDSGVDGYQYFDWYNLTIWANPDGWGDATFIGSMNHAPVLNLIGDRSINAGTPLQFTISATDPDSDSMTYSATDLPIGASLDSTAGVFTWTPSDDQAGTHVLTFVVSDGSLSDAEDVTITVNSVNYTVNKDPTSPEHWNYYEGSGSGDWGRTTDEAHTGNYSVFLQGTDYSSNFLNIGLVVGDSNGYSGLNAYDANPDTTYNVSFWIKGDFNYIDPQAMVWNTEDGSGTGSWISTSIGQVTPTSIWTQYQGTFTTPSDAKKLILVFRAYGDSSQINLGTIFVDDVEICASPNIVLNPGAENLPANNAPILNYIGAKSVDEKDALNFIISATDTDGDSLTYSATGLPIGASFDTASRTFSWTPSDGQAGTHVVTFAVSDGSLSVAEDVTITVTESSTTPSLVSITPSTSQTTPGETITLTIPITPATPITGAQFDLHFTNPLATVTSVTEGNLFNQDEAPTQFISGTIDNAAGTVTNVYGYTTGINTNVSSQGSLATISMTAGSTTGYLNLNLTNVKISDVDSNPEPYTLTNATVLIDTAPMLDSIGAQSVDEGSALIFTTGAYDDDGDGLTYSANNLPEGANFNTATGAFSWTPADGQANTYVITFEVTDGYLTDSETVTITVNDANHAPVITTFVPSSSLPYNESDIITIGIIANDEDGDALSYTIKIDGNTKSTSSSYVWETDYSSAGTHTIDITVSDGIDQVTDQRTITINDVHPRWDVNEDGTVNVLDISAIGQKYGESVETPYPRWDVNQDGEVNVQDMTLASSYFGDVVV